MRVLIRALAGSIGLLACGVLACTTTTTAADLAEEGRREDAAARGEAMEEREIIEEGGVNNRAIDEADEEVERKRDL
ncbi:MAG: hypothetical protein JRH16_16290 [Deltaproteobacteria bacterium]|nr:hypothetical protein [Deltaproteobacteria bacterium]MBW2361742.1 hypothetical protein [Deltaproteobacteria bacterium]